jgi:hypothetical protein
MIFQGFFMHRFRQRPVIGATRALLLCMVALLACGLSATTAAASSAHKVSLGGPGLRSAFADFDGDVHPDVATLHSDNSRSGTSNYAIDLQLSATGRKSIRFVGPSGGLRIEARDVNGDHIVDLVLASAWQQAPVAVYLNDGHGDFSRAAANALPDAFDRSGANWSSSSCSPNDSVGAPPRPRSIASVAAGAEHSKQVSENFIVPVLASLLHASFLRSLQSRAPPSVSLL